jgi:transcriptional regulator with XRE-family HTH domain
MTLGVRLRTMRKEKGLTLRRAADGAGISVIYLAHLEADVAEPALEVLEKLAKLYDVPLEELTAGTRETSGDLDPCRRDAPEVPAQLGSPGTPNPPGYQRLGPNPGSWQTPVWCPAPFPPVGPRRAGGSRGEEGKGNEA